MGLGFGLGVVAVLVLALLLLAALAGTVTRRPPPPRDAADVEGPLRVRVIGPVARELPETIELPPRGGIRRRDPAIYVSHASWREDRSAVAVQRAEGEESDAFVSDPNGALLWWSEETIDLTFAPGGDQLVELAFKDDSSRGGPPRCVRCRRWPSMETIAQGDVRVPFGWAEQIVLAPDASRCAVTFVDQTEWGWVVVELGTIQQRLTDVQERGTNSFATPVWSPDSRIVAGVSTHHHWWLPPRALEDTPRAIPAEDYEAYLERERDEWWAPGAAGGEVRAGTLWIHHVTQDVTRSEDVRIDLPAGWGGDLDMDEYPVAQLGPLRFLDRSRLEISLPHGGPRVIDVGAIFASYRS